MRGEFYLTPGEKQKRGTPAAPRFYCPIGGRPMSGAPGGGAGGVMLAMTCRKAGFSAGQSEDAAVGSPLGQARIVRGALKVKHLRLMVALVDRRGRDLPLLVQ